MKKTILLFAMACMTIMASAGTYALYGTVPTGATDLTAAVTATGLGTATFAEGTLTGAGLPGRLCESSNYLQLKFSAEQKLTLKESYNVCIVVKKDAAATAGLQVSFCNKGWNAARVSWAVAAGDISDSEFTTLTLAFDDRKTDNWNSYAEANTYGEERAFSGEIMRICAGNGEQYEISAIYVTDEEQQEEGEIPTQNPMRVYLHKGTAETPAGVTATDYTDKFAVVSDYWLTTPSETFYGITTNAPAEGDWDNGWWFNFFIQNNAAVDLSDVYSTWSLVFSVKNGVAEEGQDRGLMVKVNGRGLTEGNPSFVTTYADTQKFCEHKLPLTLVLKGAKSLGNVAADTQVVTFESSNDHTGGRTVEFDYIYLTNEDDTTTGMMNAALKSDVVKRVVDGRVVILKGGVMYDLMGSVVK